MSTTLQSKILRSSTGLILRDGDFLLTRYQGFIVDANGKSTIQFDANYDFATFSPVPSRTPFNFQLGSGSVIQGWEEGLANRRIGEVVELTIPPSLGYGNAAKDKIPSNSTLRFRIEIIGGFTPETFSPSGEPGFTYASLKDFGLDTKRLGLSTKDLLSVSSSIVGLSGSDILTGKDMNKGVSLERADKDLLIGLNGNDRITGGVGGDFLIGGNGQDTFRYNNLNESRLGAMDRIFDLQIGIDRIDGTRAVSAANVKELGKVSALTQAGIERLLGTENSPLGRNRFAAHQAATFSMGTGTSSRTFLAINNEVAGFNANTDGLIEITGFSGNLDALAVI